MTGHVVRIALTFHAMPAGPGELVGRLFTVWSTVGECEAYQQECGRASVGHTTLVSAFAEVPHFRLRSAGTQPPSVLGSFRTAAEVLGDSSHRLAK